MSGIEKGLIMCFNEWIIGTSLSTVSQDDYIEINDFNLNSSFFLSHIHLWLKITFQKSLFKNGIVLT